MAPKNPFRFGTDLWDPSNRFETSWLLSPWLLCALRALISLYAFVVLLFSIGWECAHASFGGCLSARESFSYFTIITYWGLAFYFAVAALHTLTYALSSRPLLDRLPRPLQALHSLLYTTIVTFPFLVTIVYWAVLYGGSSWFPRIYDAWHNVSVHALNSVFALFEIVVPRTESPPWVHAFWLVLILALYLGLAFVTFADQGFYVYDFVDFKEVGGRGIVAAYIVGIAIGIVVVFCVVWLLIWARRWLTERKLSLEGKFAAQRSWNSDQEMNTIGAKRSAR